MRKRARTRRLNTETSHPDVFLTINKNRLKIYNGNSIFLKHGDEFELEFDNRTRTKWLAKIKLNGEWVSNSGLVLRPGEHIFLDTPNLDSHDKHRFSFETYEIESGRSHLVQENGRVEVFFHKQQQLIDWCGSYTYTSHIDNTTLPPFNWRSSGTHHYDSNNGDGVSISNTSGLTSNSDSILYCSTPVAAAGPPMEETGRIEQGSESNQDFVNSQDSFESFHSHSVEYIILPVSKKSTTIQDIKQYCSGCGKRRKKNDNFCPSCGTKF